MSTGSHPFNPNCHYQILFAKFHLMTSYLPLYFKDVWHYREVNIDLIRRAMKQLIISAGKEPALKLMIPRKFLILIRQSYMFSVTLLRTRPLYVITNITHGLIVEWNLFDKIKNQLYKDYRRSNSNASLLSKLNLLQEQLKVLINKSKQKCYVQMTSKLSNISKNSLAYCSIFRQF